MIWLGEPESCERSRVGGKSASLGRLAGRWPVPEGFCLPADLHRAAMAAGRPPSTRAIQRLIASAYRELERRAGRRRPPVAVRSSATVEDAAAASFAGQHESVLNVAGARAVAAAVQRCWASAHSTRAAAYRRSREIADDGAMGVLVQRLVDADVAAVVFSADPVTGARDTVLINASWGLGQAVVDGAVTADIYRLSRDPLALSSTEVGDKDLEVVRGRGGTREVAVPADRRRRAALSPAQCLELGAVAVELEREMGWPVDLECAYEGERLSVLQCRPITALPSA